MPDEQIQYPTQCELCEAHKTDLGTLKGFEEIVKKNFPDWSIDRQSDLVIAWFEKTWKEQMAIDIQNNKKQNIKAINK